MITGVGRRSRSLLHTHRPSSVDGIGSRTSRSGGSVRALRSASTPSPAHTTSWPSRSRYRATTSATVGSSSRTRILARPLPLTGHHASAAASSLHGRPYRLPKDRMASSQSRHPHGTRSRRTKTDPRSPSRPRPPRRTVGHMGRIVLAVLGVLLALYVVFGLVVPMVVGLLKLLLIVGVIGALVVGAMMLLGKTSK